MQITKQTNSNECGMCVVNSLIQHYYKHSDKNKIVSDAVVTDKGLSIYGFETLCLNNGLEPLSYQLSFDEFKQLDTGKKFFVLLINKENSNHYVIARKTSKGVYVYDSAYGEYPLTYNQLEKVFLNIYIEVNKLKSVQIKFDKKNNWSNLNVKYLMINILFELLIGGLSIVFGLFLDVVLNLCSASVDVKTLIIICFSFLLISILKSVFNHVFTWYVNKSIFGTYKVLKNKMIQKLMNKKENLFYKVDQTYFYLLNDALYHICGFNIIEYSNLISAIVVALICLIIAAIYNPYFLIVVLVIVVSQVLILLFSIGKANNIIKDNIKSNNLNQSVASKYIDSNAMFLDYFKYQKVQQDLNICFENSVVNKTKESLYSSLVSTIKTIVADLIFIITTFIGMLLIGKNESFTVGQMLFLINVICLFSTSIGDIGLFFFKNKIYGQFYDIFSSFNEINNINNKSIVTIDKVKNITLINEDKYLELKNGENNSFSDLKELALHLGNKKIRPEIRAEINGYDTTHISQKWLNNNICYWSDLDQGQIRPISDEKIVENELIVETIKKYGLSTKSTSRQDVALYNLLNFVGEVNKIIILDHYFDIFDKKHKTFILSAILPQIMTSNFVIFK